MSEAGVHENLSQFRRDRVILGSMHEYYESFSKLSGYTWKDDSLKIDHFERNVMESGMTAQSVEQSVSSF